MKTLSLLSLLAVLMLAGCSNKSIKKAYPNSEYYWINNRQTQIYIVRKPDGSVWIVDCGNGLLPSPKDQMMISPPAR